MGASTFVFSMIWVRQSDDTGGVWFECLPTTAPPDTLLGMVQRGRGAGWLAAVADPVEGRAALLACLTDDPRWDHQVESRAEFYASLAVALEVSAADIAACGDINDEDHWLVAETLTALSVRGDSNARELLAQRIPDTWFEDLMAEPTLPFPPLNAPLSALLGNEHLVSHHDLMHRLRTTTDPDDLAALHEATRDPNRRGFRSAMLALAERGDTSFVTQVGDILAGNPVGQPRAGFLDPEAAIETSLTLAARAGADLRFDVAVAGWRATASGLALDTSAGLLEADRVILTAGAWAPALLAGASVPLSVERQVMYWFAPARPEGFAAGTLPVFIWPTMSSLTTKGVRPCSGRSAPTATSACRSACFNTSGWITLVQMRWPSVLCKRRKR